ncbi:MAG TPA: thiamine diphosphokinase, partial [Tepidimicrobium sp.]|nr:thiamine diphosphokinase [Tepidimicrobium sp.]
GNAYVSLLPIIDTGAIVTLKGFEYGLDRARINFSSTLGVSNRIIGGQGHILIHKGKCLVIVSKD